jgi:hypothetical protein
LRLFSLTFMVSNQNIKKMEKQLNFAIDGKPHLVKYEKSIVDGKTKITVICDDSLLLHIPTGFFFLSQGEGWIYFPTATDKTSAIAKVIIDVITKNEANN